MTTPRATCGTHTGLLAHHHAGEAPCGTCTRADMVRRLEAERFATPYEQLRRQATLRDAS